MKKLFAILAITLATILATGCEDNFARKLVIDNIYVNPNGWEVYTVDGQFSHYYADIPMPEITNRVFNEGMFFTYFRYTDPETYTPVQEGEGLTFFNRESNGYAWSYNVNCEYSPGNMRITLRVSDFDFIRITDRMNFRTVIFY